MRFGIDADPIGRNGSGNETFLRGVLHGAGREAVHGDSFVLAGRMPHVLAELDLPAAEVLPIAAGLRGDLELGTKLRRAGATVVLASYTAPIGFSGPVATIVHDVSYRRLPESYPSLLRLRIEASVAWSVRRSGALITPSEFSRDELLSVYPRLSGERVVVVPGAASAAFAVEPSAAVTDDVRRRYSLPEEFVLAVGDVHPRKNITRLVTASEHAGVPLVVVGRARWGTAGTGSSDRPGRERWLGYVPTEDLVALFHLCSVFAYPSLYEGFGLPVVEAMAAGAPVITSSTTALAEVAGDATIRVDPTSVEEIADAIHRVMSSPELRQSLAIAGRERANQFSWERSGAMLLHALRGLVVG